MAEKKYVSIFERKEFKTLQRTDNKKAIKEKLTKVKRFVKRLKEEDEMPIEAQVAILDKAVDTIEDIITDVIDSAGANNAVVDELINTVDNLEDIQDEVEVGVDIADVGEIDIDDDMYMDDDIGMMDDMDYSDDYDEDDGMIY